MSNLDGVSDSRRWAALAQQIATEKEPKRLVELAKQLTHELVERERRLEAAPILKQAR